MNLVILTGRLGKSPELKTLPSGAAFSRFSLATSESYKDKDGEWQEKTEWHNILMWRKMAENAVKILKKGDLINIQGKIEYRKWTDNDGVPKNMAEIVVSKFDKLVWKKGDGLPAPTEPYTSYNPDDVKGSVDEQANDDLPF